MFGISGEHLLILFIVLIIFGPRRLPELGNTMGKAIRNFKDAISGVEEARYRKIEEETTRPHASPAAVSPATQQAQNTEPASPGSEDPNQSKPSA